MWPDEKFICLIFGHLHQSKYVRWHIIFAKSSQNFAKYVMNPFKMAKVFYHCAKGEKFHQILSHWWWESLLDSSNRDFLHLSGWIIYPRGRIEKVYGAFRSRRWRLVWRVWPDWAIFESSCWQNFKQKWPKLLATFWASLNNLTLM